MRFASVKVVLDTNTLVSAALYPESISAKVVAYAVQQCELYASAETLEELRVVLMRDKFTAYFAKRPSARQAFLEHYRSVVLVRELTRIATECIDPKDNQFLSLAWTVGADYLITGDIKHLIPMNPYKNTVICSARDFILMQTNRASPPSQTI